VIPNQSENEVNNISSCPFHFFFSFFWPSLLI